jgi:aspartyl-tRNA(Asn)/glutamyl-tRNA(Gln) amidotransferase subunit A
LKPPPGLAGLLHRLGSGQTDARTSLEEARARVDGLDSQDRTLRHRFDADGEPDREWWGVPFLTKANIAVLHQPLDCGSAILEGFRAPYEATVIARLRMAGASCLGATNMDEFAMGSSGETSINGTVEHPFLKGRVCGGSSSGSAAAVARGLVPFALGSDTGGSVRQPAAYCGLVGLKPTWGRVSRHGLVAHASSLDTIGVIAASVEDAALVLERIAGPDGLDSTVRTDIPPRGRRPIDTVGVLRTATETMSPEVMENLRQVNDALRASGIRVTEICLPALDSALAAYLVIAAAEAASNLARYDGSIYGARVEAVTYEESVRETRTRGFGPEVKLRILLGTEVLRQGHTANAPGRARQIVARLDRECAAVFADHDALLMPTVPDVAFGLGTRFADPLAMREVDRFTVGPSLLGLPAVAVPSGEDADGAPLSVQCIAARGQDDRALALAGLVEEAMGSRRLREQSWWPRIRGVGN